MKTLAIIPARGGSKGIYKKNIRDLCGKPLIYYQLRNALDSKLIDDVVLSSDSDEILDIGRKLFGTRIVISKRPPEISTDSSKTEETLLHVLDQLKRIRDYDIVVTLEPTNPLNETKYIDQCMNMLADSNIDAICCAVHDYSFRLETEEDVERVLKRPMKSEISPGVKECGNCWATKVDALRRTKNRLGFDFTCTVIPKKDSYHLDSEDDWIIVEALMKQKLLHENDRYCYSRKNLDKYDKRYWKDVIDTDGKSRDKTQEKEKRINECKEEISYINSLQPGRVLDVGCGLGFLLSGIDDRWEKWGVELSEYAAQHALQYGNVLCGVLRASKLESNSFDAVLLHHVVEHFQDPVSELIEIKRILKPNGKLVLGMPDFECETARRFGENFRLLNDKTHLSLFGSFDMFRLLTDLFFEIENVSYPFYGTEYFTKENLNRLFDTSRVSPAALGNIVTFYARKK